MLDNHKIAEVTNQSERTTYLPTNSIRCFKFNKARTWIATVQFGAQLVYYILWHCIVLFLYLWTIQQMFWFYVLNVIILICDCWVQFHCKEPKLLVVRFCHAFIFQCYLLVQFYNTNSDTVMFCKNPQFQSQRFRKYMAVFNDGPCAICLMLLINYYELYL